MAPPRTARFSACRRIRVARWSTWKRPLSRSGSSTWFSSSSSSSISRCTRDWRRRARFTKTSTFCSLPLALLRAMATASMTADSAARPAAATSWASRSRVSPLGTRPCSGSRRWIHSPCRTRSSRSYRSDWLRAQTWRSRAYRATAARASELAAAPAVSTMTQTRASPPHSTTHSRPVSRAPPAWTTKAATAVQITATRRQGMAASLTRRDRIAESAADSGNEARPCRPPSRSRRRAAAGTGAAPGEPWGPGDL